MINPAYDDDDVAVRWHPASPRVAIVVDADAGVPAALADAHRIVVLPDLTGDDPLALARAALRSAPCDQADHVVSVHPWPPTSPGHATMTALAVEMAAAGGVVVHPVDSESVAMGVGWVALTAARAAAVGMGGDAVRDLAVRVAKRSSVVVAAQDSDHLHLGRLAINDPPRGRVRAGKPLCKLARGRVTSAGRVRSMGAAVARLTELAAGCAGGWPAHITVQHDEQAKQAKRLARALRQVGLGSLGTIDVVEFSAAARDWVGPGALGVVVSPVDWHIR